VTVGQVGWTVGRPARRGVTLRCAADLGGILVAAEAVQDVGQRGQGTAEVVGERDPGRLSAPARPLGGGQPPAQQAAGDQADQRPGLVPRLLDGNQQADEGWWSASGW
jgi:hypothetical protein